MSDLRAVAHQALEAIDKALPHAPHRGEFDALADMADALRARLATGKDDLQVEPVAWMDIASDGTRLSVRMWSDGNFEEVPLYTALVQRKPLTDEEIDTFWKKHWWGFVSFEEARVIARAIEKAHGIGVEE